MHIDLRVLELLASKLCHDLVSPVSAINNGVELIEDIGGDVVDEAMKLIGDSAGQAARRLRFFRIAYGRAGSEENLAVKDVRPIAEQCLGTGKVTLNWPEDSPGDEIAAHRGSLKTLINMLALGEELLAYGGSLSVQKALVPGQKECRVVIAGRSVQLSPPLQGALEDAIPLDDLTPRTIQAYITGRFAAHFGLKIGHVQETPEQLVLTLLPAVD